ncbi:tetratricopeptide repeat protein [Thiocapsa roseopersicina]|uniref:Flp pilus assembly protein TadD, contains TPR repeats n=1 Tax=Thiocapsa roseopersicina TaxID=1058 RepID=A0A1H2QL13_THIRO|nr:tetratricopeptide repeat protein [Thiocapsa roseopersicina]SDW07846.1 Flp pilus assembly protein TadD, contains TPR repeats [Thiocapsa roseopersicina]
MPRSFLLSTVGGFFAVLAFLSAGAFAQIPDPASSPESTPAPAGPPQPERSADTQADRPEADAAGLSGGLDADQIYAVLVAEIAARRGDMDTAFTYYLEAADLTKDPRLTELAVRSAITAGNDAATEQGLRRWLDLDPTSTGAHQMGAFSRIKANDHEGALMHLMRLVQLSPDDPDAAFGQAAAIISRAPTPAARVGLMQALADQFPQSAHAQQSLAMVAASASQLEIADAAARRALELSPEWNKPRLFLVKLLISSDKRGEARSLLEEYLALSPDDQVLRMLYGQLLVEEEEFSSARDVFQRLLDNRPKEPDVLFAVGVLSLQLEDTEGARIYFTRLYETGERRDEAAFYLGQVEERAENPEAALAWYGKVKGTNSVDAQIRTALLSAKGGDIRRAREILQQLRDRGPDNAVLLYLVETEILESVGRPDEAMAIFDSALQAFPDDENLLYARALSAVKLDRIVLAEQDLRRIIEIDPEHADALNALGYTLADRTDRYAEAKGYIEKAYALKPDEPAILDSMGWVHYRLGDYETALDYLRRALEHLSDGEIAAHLGEVLWAMNRREEALEVWEAAAKEHPDHGYLKEVMGRHRASGGEPSR